MDVGVTADLLKGVSAGAEMQVFTTLGLENNLVNDSMVNARLTGLQMELQILMQFDDRTDDAPISVSFG